MADNGEWPKPIGSRPASPAITQADVDAVVKLHKALRAAGIGPRGKVLYDLDRLRAAIEACAADIALFESKIEEVERRRRDLKALLREQESIHERLQRGEHVEGYSAPRE